MAALSTLAVVGLASGGATLLSSFEQANALNEQTRRSERVSAAEADLMRTNADLKKKVAEEDAQVALKRGQKIKSAQRSIYAASGVDVNSGSAANVQNETDLAAALDAQTIRNNATLEAFGLKSRAKMTELQGEYNAMAYRNRAGAAVTSGVLSAGTDLYKGFSPEDVKMPTVKGSTR